LEEVREDVREEDMKEDMKEEEGKVECMLCIGEAVP
jgi:hypothetical protein